MKNFSTSPKSQQVKSAPDSHIITDEVIIEATFNQEQFKSLFNQDGLILTTMISPNIIKELREDEFIWNFTFGNIDSLINSDTCKNYTFIDVNRLDWDTHTDTMEIRDFSAWTPLNFLLDKLELLNKEWFVNVFEKDQVIWVSFLENDIPKKFFIFKKN